MTYKSSNHLSSTRFLYLSRFFASKMNTNNFNLIVYCVVTVRQYGTIILVFGILNFWMKKSVSFQFPCHSVALSKVNELNRVQTYTFCEVKSTNGMFFLCKENSFFPLALLYFSAALWGNVSVR